MDIKNIKNNKGFYYYSTDEFATVKIKFSFLFNNTKENYIKSHILSAYMTRTNKKYRTIKEIKNRCKELYGLHFSIYSNLIGTKNLMSFELKMVDPKLIGEDYFNEALSFFEEMILNPNFDNNLDTKLFDEIKKELINNQKNQVKNSEIMQERLLYKYLIPNNDINNVLVTDIDEYEVLVSSVKEQDLIDFYYLLLNNFVSGYSFGNLSENENKKIMSIFDFKPIDFDYQYNLKEKINNEEKLIVSKDTSQSYLYVVYEIKDYDFKNNYLYKTIKYMLNSMNGLCLDILRNKLGIVYNAYSDFESRCGLMYICAQIDQKNKDIALNGIDEIFEKLCNKNEIKRLLKYAVEKQNQLYYTNTENLSSNINELENYVYKKFISSEEEIKLVNKIKIDDIIKQVNNFEKKFIFFYKGEKNEK